jgi:hypothetical protein
MTMLSFKSCLFSVTRSGSQQTQKSTPKFLLGYAMQIFCMGQREFSVV